MYHIEFDDGLRVLYTGDFNMVDSMVHKAAKAFEADVLITEATYGTPEWVFPKRKDVYEQVLSAAKTALENHKIPVFKAYSLGKAQETIALLQREGIEVISGNKTIDSVSKVYNRHGANLEFESIHSRKAIDMLKKGAPIICSSLGHTIRYLRKIFGHELARQFENSIEKYTLSGWTLGRYAERGFPLSGHSDFPHLLKFAKATKPRIVYSFTDNAQEFSKHLSQLGINAVPLE